MVSHLSHLGWAIQSVANTSTKEHGVDIIAAMDGSRLLVEVKGYPSRYYVHGDRKGEVKKTAPSIQARVWFADLIMSSMLNSGDEPEANIVLCLPDLPTYRNLYDRVSPSLSHLGFTAAWVNEEGEVEWPGIVVSQASDGPLPETGYQIPQKSLNERLKRLRDRTIKTVRDRRR
jgi:hypothetical protein